MLTRDALMGAFRLGRGLGPATSDMTTVGSVGTFPLVISLDPPIWWLLHRRSRRASMAA